jgi:hypothetical protein
MKNLPHSLYSLPPVSRLSVFCVFSLFVLKLHGQGTVAFQNIGVPAAVTNRLTGERAEVGTTFSVGLYFAPDGIIEESQFVQLGRAVNIGVFGGMMLPEFAGYFIGGTRIAPIPPASYAMFQVRAWETSFGSTYEEAVGNADPQNGRLALVGESGIMRALTGSPSLPGPVPPTPLAAGPPWVVAVVGAPLRDGFVLEVVPEPKSALLLLLGLPVLIFLRRRHGRR